MTYFEAHAQIFQSEAANKNKLLKRAEWVIESASVGKDKDMRDDHKQDLKKNKVQGNLRFESRFDKYTSFKMSR